MLWFWTSGQNIRLKKFVMKTEFDFYATNTKNTKLLKSFENFNFNHLNLKKKFDNEIVQKLQDAKYILVSIPPKNKQEIVLKNFGKILFKIDFIKLIYLSATSVYGNHNGKWVYEKAKQKGLTKFGKRRKKLKVLD